MTLALLTAFAVMAMRFAMHLLGNTPEGMDFMFVHFMALVTVIFFTGLQLMRAHRPVGFPELMRESFKNAAVYSLLIGLFIWLFYTYIDTTSIQTRLDDLVVGYMRSGKTEEEVRPSLEQLVTPFNLATISFFALLVVSAILSLVLSGMQHKVFRRFMR